MGEFRVEPVRGADRSALCRMLESSSDFPQGLVGQYRQRTNRAEVFVAWRGDELVGMLSGYFDSNFVGRDEFDSFELSPAPHGFLERIHVSESERGRGTGRALVAIFAGACVERGTTFVGGPVDTTGDVARRRRFFRSAGFDLSGNDYFGADPVSVLARTSIS